MTKLSKRPRITPDVPLALISAPGAGKTAWVESHARPDYPVVALILSTLDPSDVVGVNWVEDVQCRVNGEVQSVGSTRRMLPEWFIRLCNAGQGILFIDELTTAAPALQAAALRLINERAIDNHKLPAKVSVVAAYNPPSTTSGAYDLSPAMANRFCHIPFEVDAAEWAGGTIANWGKQVQLDEAHRQAAALVASFIKNKGDATLHAFPDDKNAQQRSLAWPSPRSWTNGVYLIADAIRHKEEPTTMLAGVVGTGPAQEFYKFSQTMDLPDPEELLSKGSFKFNEDRADLAMVIMASVYGAVANNPTRERWNAAANIIADGGQVQRDIAAFTLTPLMKLRQTQWPIPTRLAELAQFFDSVNKVGAKRAKK